ncbi:class I SAM-dependent methyltransferase [Candidatus Hakubella thermalkaliphila]|uniref:class I SAM-dependent methyltransferase n=1 Tax=Candidatus Hakubella thermalkaliphila TaxID=2754717 RepID=UPI001592EC1C|nr:class I SAM-dependent methyltransferase [Candidatus Hakubella thermalkaliphila]
MSIYKWLRQKISSFGVSWDELVLFMHEEIPPGARVLDAGAGECILQKNLAHADYISMDSTVGDLSANYSKLDIIGDLTCMPIRDGLFDAVVSLNVLEHVISPEKAIKEFNRILKIGGKLFLMVPQASGQHQKPYDYWRFTSFGLRHLLETSGFHIISLEPRGGYFLLMGDQLKALQKLSFLGADRPILLPLKVLWQILSFPIFRVAIPLIFYYLDALDRDKDNTVGYICYASKLAPAVAEKMVNNVR